MFRQEKRWITDGEQIFFGPGQGYKIQHIRLFSIGIQAAGVLLVILSGSGVSIKDPSVAYMVSLVGFAVFLYGIHLNGIARAAAKEAVAGLARRPWTEDGKERVSLGGKRTCTVFQATVYAFLIRFLSFVVLILSGIRMLGGEQYMAIISFALAGVAFMYGRQLGKAARGVRMTALRRMEEEMRSVR